VVAKDRLEYSVLEFSQRLIKNNSGQSMMLTKRLIADVQSMPLSDALNYAAEMNARARATDDCKKGIAAFLEKKDLSW
jgi:methylglutaconyl-CoA hydratase